MKSLYRIIDIISTLLFKLDQRIIFIFVEPKRYPSNTTNLKILNNLFFFLKDFELTLFFKEFIFLIYYNLMIFLKIIYLPIILIFYKSKKKFIQLNFSQIGILNEHLNFMIKKNKIDGFESIILIPKNSKFGFLKNIFSNLKIIDNIFLNLLLMPLKHSELSSCKAKKIDNFLNKNYELKLKTPHSYIYNKYKEKLNHIDNFELNNEYIQEEETKFYFDNKNLDLERLIVFHHREKFFNKTSDLRGSEIETYIEGLKLLLKNNYSVIRLVDKDSKKIFFSSNKYLEYDITNLSNRKSQFFLIKKSKGFLGTSSGPVSIASLFNTPILETNVYGQRVNAFTNKGSYILKKVEKNGVLLPYDEVIKFNFYKGMYYSRRKLLEEGLVVVDNTSEEIYKAIKHFDYLLSIKNYEPSTEQRNFKKSLPDYMELKFTDSNIDPNFIKLNKKLFQSLIF